ncbi:MFS transporter [Rhodobacterales bacterium]|nr:MFS transporter [Rhodobacterales bacterium]
MAFPLAFAGLPIYLHAPDFYASVMNQPVTAIGTVLLVLRLVDALQDPVIGKLSDRYHEARSAILFIGTILLGAGFWMLFNPLSGATLFWFAASVLICTTGFSIVSINFQALGGLWDVPPKARTAVTAGREGFGLVGLLVASVLPTVLAGWLGTAEAFHWLTLAYLPLLALGLFLLWRWLRTVPLEVAPVGTISLSWRAILASRWRRLFFSILFLNGFASAIPAVLVLFFVRDRLGAENLTGLFLLIYFLAGALSMPLWSRLAGRYGKLRAWRLSMLVAILTFFWAVALGRGDATAFAFVCALSGLALGADLAIPPALLADHIDEDARQANASGLFAIMAFLSKSALALATGLTLPALGLAGYQPDGPMTRELDLALSLTYAGLPCVLKLAAFCAIWLYEKDLAPDKAAV